jgi:hypothetical protein
MASDGGGSQQLPDNIRNSGIFLSERIVASIGGPVVAATIKEPPGLGILAALTFALGLVAYIIAELANYFEVKRHWSFYRCHPSVMPFAKFYGHNFTETMNFCVGQAVAEHASGVIRPIEDGVNKVLGVVDEVYQKAEAVEGGIGQLIGGFERFVLEFANAMRTIGTRFRMSVIRIKEIFERVHGIFISFAFAAISAITFGENLICNPLVTFLGTIAGVDVCCFAQGTLIRTADGIAKPIEAVRIGDQLWRCGTVTSVYKFYGTLTSMVIIRGVVVSGNHYVWDDVTQCMVHAEEHSEAERCESVPILYCLATSSNWIPIIDNMQQTLMCADYEESDAPTVVAAAQAAAERGLNGTDGYVGPTVHDYSLGIDPTQFVKMSDGTWQLADTIHIGDILESGAWIVGIVHEDCEELCITPGYKMVSAAQLIQMADGTWMRAAHVWPTLRRYTRQMVQFITSDGGSLLVRDALDSQPFRVRDYQEWTGSEVQAIYDAAMCEVKQGITVYR